MRPMGTSNMNIGGMARMGSVGYETAAYRPTNVRSGSGGGGGATGSALTRTQSTPSGNKSTRRL
jgi:hypothetical protein